jgi:hypothetical protein
MVAARAAGTEPVPALTATRAFPTGSQAAQVNARLDANGIRF